MNDSPLASRPEESSTARRTYSVRRQEGRVQTQSRGKRHAAGLVALLFLFVLSFWVASTRARAAPLYLPVPGEEASQESEETVPPGQTEPEERNSERRSPLLRVAYRERNSEVFFQRAQREVAAGNMELSLQFIQQLLDAPHDSFLQNQQTGRVSSARLAAKGLLERMPVDWRGHYETREGLRAEQLLNRSLQQFDWNGVASVERKYFGTAAGFRATRLIANRAWDRGDFDASAERILQLINSPLHRHRVTPTILAQGAMACQRAGRTKEAEDLWTKLKTQPIPLPEGLVRGDELRARNEAAILELPTRSDRWFLSGGTANRNGRTTASLPRLEPRWTVSYARQKNAGLNEVLEKWEQMTLQGQRVPTTPIAPIFVDDMLVFRDFGGIRAIHPDTGRTIWSYSCRTALDKIIRQNPAPPPSSARRGSNSKRARPINVADIQTAYTANSSQGAITTDGQRIYFLDAMEAWIPPASASGRRGFGNRPEEAVAEKGLSSNELVALPVPLTSSTTDSSSPSPRPLWQAGGEGKPTTERPLAGHFFLGPPLPVHGLLYATTEFEGLIRLVALNPETGHPVWQQPMAFADRAIDVDRTRYPLAVPLAAANGTLICSPHVGVIVAVEALTGGLIWTNVTLDPKENEERDPFRQIPQGRLNGLPQGPRIHDGVVVILPAESTSLHGFELATGRELWKTPRLDMEYVAAIENDVVLVVGANSCRGISLRSGLELWQSHPGDPAGEGIHIAKHYLLPLADGRIVMLEISTGHEVGYSPGVWSGKKYENLLVHTSKAIGPVEGASKPLDENRTNGDSETILVRPGNLVAGHGMLFSAGSRGLTAFPQTAPLLKTLLARASRNQPNLQPADEILLVEMELATGRFESARERLSRLLKSTPGASQTARLESLARGAYLHEIRSGRGSISLLDDVRQLARSNEDHATQWRERAEFLLRRDDLDGVLSAVVEFMKFGDVELFSASSEPSLNFDSSTWIASVIGELERRGDSRQQSRLDAWIDERRQRALSSDGIADREAFVRQFSWRPEAVRTRELLAKELRSQGRLAEAELMLLSNASSKQPNVAAGAWSELATLWNTTHYPASAAMALTQLESFEGRAVLAGDKTPKGFLAESLSSPTNAPLREFRDPVAWHVNSVSIESTGEALIPWNLLEVSEKFRRRLPLANDLELQLIERGVEGKFEFNLVDRQALSIRAQTLTSGAYFQTDPHRKDDYSHTVYLGGFSEALAISTLQGEKGLLWKTVLKTFPARDSYIRPILSTSQLLLFIEGDSLWALDAATGRVLWRRTRLEKESGFLSGGRHSLIGDDEILVAFSSDRSRHTAYRTRTGEILRRGKLPIHQHEVMESFGRRVFYVAQTPQGERLRLWDALTDRHLFNAPAPERIRAAALSHNELALILPNSQLAIVDVQTGARRAEITIPKRASKIPGNRGGVPNDEDEIVGLRGFSDDDHWYVTVQRPSDVQVPETYTYFASDMMIPAEAVHGDFFVFDRKTGKMLWQRPLEHRSLIRTGRASLPFLISVSRVAQRSRGNRQWMRVEVFDRATGRLLGEQENIIPDRLMYFSADTQQGTVELLGIKSTIRLRFDRKRQHLEKLTHPPTL